MLLKDSIDMPEIRDQHLKQVRAQDYKELKRERKEKMANKEKSKENLNSDEEEVYSDTSSVKAEIEEKIRKCDSVYGIL